MGGLIFVPERMELHFWRKTERAAQQKGKRYWPETLMEYSSAWVASHEVILEKLWDDAFVDDNTLSVNITRVRKRLSRAWHGGNAFETVQGLGWQILTLNAEEPK
ncbi:helix-turn-helix domain-containing protein [Paenibacillus sp. JTLBN-2024]